MPAGFPRVRYTADPDHMSRIAVAAAALLCACVGCDWMYPSNSQRELNAHLIEVVRDGRWELGKSHLIDFEIVFDEYDAASEACESLRELGFAPEVSVDRRTGAYDCHARKRFALTLNQLNDESASVEKAAAIHGGVFAVWTPISEQ